MSRGRKSAVGLVPSARRAAGYVRVSQVGDRGGDTFLSPEVQREKIEAWASYRDFRVIGWYVDLDVSGRTGVRRPEFERMMEDAKQGRFEAVAVYRLTRFGRSVQDAARRYSELREAGVELVSVTEDIDTSTASGAFLQNILFAMGEFESERIGEEWRNVHANRRRKGIAHTPRGMYGYRVEGSAPVAIEEAQAVAVRLIFDMRSKQASLNEIRSELERRGFRSPTGRSLFGRMTLTQMLDNPVYAGLVKQPDGSLIEGRHPAIVNRDQWERAQALRQRSTRLSRHRSLLGGLLVCHACGYHMVYERHAPGKGFTRYRCTGSDLAERCPRPVQVGAERVETYVDRAFLRRFAPLSKRRVSSSRQQRQWEQKAAKLYARVIELDRALDALADQRYVKGSLEEAEYHRQFARFASQREEAQNEADEHARLARLAQPVERDVLSLWPVAAPEVKRAVLRQQIESIVVHPYNGPPGQQTRRSVGHRLTINWAS